MFSKVPVALDSSAFPPLLIKKEGWLRPLFGAAGEVSLPYDLQEGNLPAAPKNGRSYPSFLIRRGGNALEPPSTRAHARDFSRYALLLVVSLVCAVDLHG